jgi:uric acid-xanthine permease
MGWKQHMQVADYEPELDFPPPGPICTNGEVMLGYGSPQYIGLGLSVMCGLVIIEIFGSTFMKNCNVFLALMFGYFISAVSNYQGLSYVNTEAITSAPAITFLWVYTFPIGFYAPAVIPLLIAYMVTTVETIGDLTAVYEVSELDTGSQEYQETIQGGITSDAFGSILASLFTSMPNTTFAQNNGVIAMTRCASRRAGYGCGCWLIFMGIFGKIAGVIVSIPDAVLGGMTIFLFANVLTAGLALAATLDLHNRRNKFILAMSLAIGIGVNVWPFAFLDMRASFYTANFWRCSDCSDTMKGLRNGVSIFLSHGYCVGTVVAMVLNTILPEDVGVNIGRDEDVPENGHNTEIVKSMVEPDEEITMSKEDEVDEDNEIKA